MDTILSINGLEYAYPDGTKALRGITMEVQRGSRVAVLGSNGSGKSTLFLCLNGVYRPKAGQVCLEGRPVQYDKKGLAALRKNVGVVFQDPETQLFCVDVYQEVAFGPYNLGYDPQQVDRCVTESLEAMDLMDLKDKPPHFLSGGQKKRVSVAAVLSMSPQVLLFDEPVAALDPIHARRMMNEMDQLSARGITILMATHDVDSALAWADQAVVLNQGLVEAAGAPLDIFTDQALLERNGLEPPAVLRVYQMLCRRGLLSQGARPPRSLEELDILLGGR